MARRATSLGPKPSLFIFFVFCFLFFFVFVFFGGFKGQVRWPEGPPHLALNPPYLFCFFVCFLFVLFFLFFGGGVVFSFLSLLLSEKNQFSPKKGHFCLFLSVSLCFSWAFFGLPLVQFLFLCLSLVLFFLSSFLSFLFCFLLVPSFSLFLSFSVFFAFVSWKLTTSKDSIAKFFFINPVSFLVSCLVFSFKSLFLSLFFPGIQLCFLFNINVFGFKKHKLKNTNFWSKGELQQNVFFNNLCFAKCEKLSFFFAPFLAKFWLMFKKTL